MTQRLSFASACSNSCLMAVVYFLNVGFQQGFDVFGWYGVGWSGGDWTMFVVLISIFPTILFGEWWSQRKKAQEKASGE